MADLMAESWETTADFRPLSKEEMGQIAGGRIAGLGERLFFSTLVKGTLVWECADGARLKYPDWPDPMRRRFEEICRLLAEGAEDLKLDLPSERTINPDSYRAYLTAQQAFDVYAAHAAHALLLEAQGQVPWSLAAHPPAELAVLFFSGSYHSIILPSDHNRFGNHACPPGIEPGRDFGEAPENHALGEFSGDPRTGYRFMAGKTSRSGRGLIGRDERDTLANLTAWLLDNVGHGRIADAAHNRFLEDRLRRAPGEAVALATQGCHGASKLMVDLARSVNLPLLHTRSQGTNSTEGSFFYRTHGGLVHGWAGSDPLILWHTDEIYAIEGEPAFPIDGSGRLLPADQARRLTFEQRWRTPSQLEGAGFVYNLHTVRPGHGFGVPPLGTWQELNDYGAMAGYWKNDGALNLPMLMRLEQNLELCGAGLLESVCSIPSGAGIQGLIDQWRGDADPDELPPMHGVEEYVARGARALDALGGCDGFRRAWAEWRASRGNDLLA